MKAMPGDSPLGINSNMGCIEMTIDTFEPLLVRRINSNMGCIEMTITGKEIGRTAR